MDEEFLDSIMGEQGVGRVDDFTGQLWKSWKRIRDDGIAQVRYILCIIYTSILTAKRVIAFRNISF